MRFSLLAAVALLSTSLAGHASTIETFNVTDATFNSGASGSGTVTIDPSAGTFVGLDFTYQLGATMFQFTTISTQSSFDNGTQYFLNSDDAAGDLLVLDLPGANLVNYMGNTICTVSTPCDGYKGYVTPANGANDLQVTGSLVATTPEPSSIALLSTGLLGVAGVMRKRFA